ncbi:SDR family oxidoreductase [soil metagenome]
MTQYVLITGGSNGIGKEFAKLFSAAGFNLVIAARDKDLLSSVAQELETKYKNTVVSIALDLSEAGAAQKLFDEVTKKNIQIEILVNNAGFGSGGKFWEIDAQKETEEIHLNILTVTMLCKLFVPQMIERKSGKILNVSSIAAFLPGPLMAVYYASKAYVLSFSNALREELAGTGVSVTTLCPRQTGTNFANRAGVTKAKSFRSHLLTPQQVAKAGFDGLMNEKAIVFSDLSTRILAFCLRFVPYAVAAGLAKQTNQS